MRQISKHNLRKASRANTIKALETHLERTAWSKGGAILSTHGENRVVASWPGARPSQIRAGARIPPSSHLSTYVEKRREDVERLAGKDRADWAVAQLKQTPERVKSGWPNPCKAARMSMGGKTVQR